MSGKVIVIGGGAAAVWSALAARRAGADVLLIRQAPGASALSSGCFDLAAEPDPIGLPLPIAAAAGVVARVRPSHPFATIDELPATIADAFRLITEEHSELGVRGSVRSDSNLRLVTPFGAMKQTALAQGPIAAGDLADWPTNARIGVVSVANRAAFDAHVVVAGLAGEGFDAVALPALYEGGPQASLMQLAAALDVTTTRETFVSRVLAAAKQAGARLVLLPTAGLTQPRGTIGSFREIKAAEILGVPPSVPGLRLDADLERRLTASGVELVRASVRSAVTDGGLVRRIVLDDGREIRSHAFILATGRFIGGGIRHDESGFHEPVFGLPVFVDGYDVGDRWLGSLLSRNAGEDQSALRAGLRIDAEMRPADEAGRPPFQNVFAAGNVIGGFDPTRDRNGLGAIAVTAVVAGRAAATQAYHAGAASFPAGGARP
jgi:glycerol-3-phosphate dehydrogenase subunit B